MQGSTRFADLPRPLAVLVLAAIAVLVLIGMVGRGSQVPSSTVVPARNDLGLYRTIAARVGAGENYYAAAASEQRAEHYPLKPFVAVRLPTLAVLTGRVGPAGASLILGLIAGAALLTFHAANAARLGPAARLCATAALASTLAIDLVPSAAAFHESWAAALIVLSLALRSERRWAASVLAGFAACAFRELAVGYLLVMAAAAVVDGTRREVAAWIAALAAFAAMMLLHAHAVASVLQPGDAVSPGWSGHGGWAFVLRMMLFAPAFSELPPSWLAAIVPLCLLGWLSWRDPVGLRGAAMLGGYVAIFMLFGRADNDYWGLILVPLVPVGLVFAPRALADLCRACVRPPRRPLITAG